MNETTYGHVEKRTLTHDEFDGSEIFSSVIDASSAVFGTTTTCLMPVAAAIDDGRYEHKSEIGPVLRTRFILNEFTRSFISLYSSHVTSRHTGFGFLQAFYQSHRASFKTDFDII